MSSAAQLDACEAAVRSDLASAATACVVPKGSINLFSADNLSADCMSAMKAGEQAGKLGPKLPAPMRAGLLKDFDQKLARCKAPPPQDEVPMRDTVQLWE
jgi:hypothetical protein